MDQQWYSFMATDNWVVFMNIMKILTFILLAVIIFILITEIDIVKELDKNHCAICMEKTGCQCFCLDPVSINIIQEQDGKETNNT